MTTVNAILFKMSNLSKPLLKFLTLFQQRQPFRLGESGATGQPVHIDPAGHGMSRAIRHSIRLYNTPEPSPD